MSFSSELDGETGLKVSAASGLTDGVVQLKRKIGDKDVVMPTFHVDDKHFSVEWTHDLSGGRSLTAVADQGDETLSLELSGNEDGGWTASAKAPWSKPQDVDVAFGKKLSVSSIGNLGFAGIRSLKGE